MERHFLSFALCFLLIFASFAQFARADVLITPENNFYKQHQDDCTYVNRNFYANSQNGFVSLKKEPGSAVETDTVKNGEVLNIVFTYDYSGEIWGVAMLDVYGNQNGWIPMSQLVLVYDYISFEEDHKNEFYSYTGGYDTLKITDKIIMWSWPGSGVQQGAIEQKIDDYFSVSTAYTDMQGQEWGFINYWHGYRNCWICLSDPSNSGLSALNPPSQPPLWPAKTPHKSLLSIPVLIMVLVAVLVVSTAVLIRALWKPKKKIMENTGPL